MKKYYYSGFSLIELLVVIAIIAILIGLSLIGLQGARETSRDTKRKADLESIRSALELYKADCGLYPANFPEVGEKLIGPADCGGNEYLTAPEDPMPSERKYAYSSIDGGLRYNLCAALETDVSPEENCGSCQADGESIVCSYKVVNP